MEGQSGVEFGFTYCSTVRSNIIPNTDELIGVVHTMAKNCKFSLRYLDNVVNKQTVSPPIPHLHALLTSGDEPPPEIDVFDLIKTSYEVRKRNWST